MNINIIASSCTELNNQYVFSLLKNRDKTKNHVIIAPDRSQFSIEQRLFEETGEKCFFDINVISLSRLSKTILKGNKKNVLTKQSGVALVKKILKDNKDKLLTFNKATSFMGFASSLFETICFYKSCNVKPNEVFVDDSNSLANLKQKDIKLIYSEYENYLQNEYTDSFNQLQLFADKIDKNTFPNTIFYFIEFDDFTRLMYNIIHKISKFTDGIYITCSYGKDNVNSNLFNNKVYYDLIEIYKSDNLNFKINKIDGFKDDIRRHLSSNLLAYTPKPCDLSNSNISIKSFDTISDEIKYTICDIYNRVVATEDSLSNYAIIVPSFNDYKSLIESELIKYDLPYYFDESQKLIDNYLIRLIFDTCVLFQVDYRLPQFSVVLKSPLLNFDASSVGDYDNYLRRVGAISDMCLRQDKTQDAEIIEFINFIKETREDVKAVKTFADCVDIIIKVYDYIMNRISSYETSLSAIELRTYEQVINKFDNINKDILNVFGDVDIASFEEFVEVYKEYFDSTNISLPPITSNTLFIADFNSSYISNYDYIYVLGNNDSKLPSQKLDNGLVTDEELLKLPNAKKLTPTIAMLNARKSLKLFDIIFKFKKGLTLFYSNSNKEGKLYPNKLVSSLQTIGNLTIKNYSYELDVINKSFVNLDSDNISFNNMTQKVAEDNLINFLALWDVYNSNINYREICSSLYELSSSDIKDILANINNEQIIDNLSNHKFFANGYSSISQIETYNRCPYVHFARYGLRVQDNSDTNLQPRDIGNIIHETLSQVVPFIIQNPSDMDSIKEKAKDILTQLLKKEKYQEIVENHNNAYTIKALYKELDRIVVAVFCEINNSNFVPKYYEYRFDNILSINGVNLKGFIDRIDTYANGFLIIDYKTGDNQFSNYNDVYSGRKLQLLVYAKAFEQKTGLECKGFFYLPISNEFGDIDKYRFNGVLLGTDDNIVDIDKGLAFDNYKSNTINLRKTSKGKIRDSVYYRNMCISKEDFDYLLNFAIKQVEKSIKNIKEGNINPYPLTDKDGSVCKYCEFKALCNYNNNNPHEIINVENINKIKELEDGGIWS